MWEQKLKDNHILSTRRGKKLDRKKSGYKAKEYHSIEDVQKCKKIKGYQHKGFPSGPPPQY